jgi:hypothetical protein
VNSKLCNDPTGFVTLSITIVPRSIASVNVHVTISPGCRSIAAGLCATPRLLSHVAVVRFQLRLPGLAAVGCGRDGEFCDGAASAGDYRVVLTTLAAGISVSRLEDAKQIPERRRQYSCTAQQPPERADYASSEA